jgi:hypothetical protein
MTNTSTIIRALIGVIAGFVAIYLGTAVVTARTEAFMWVALASGLTLCVWLGRDIWLLIPLTMYWQLSFPWLPGGFPPSQIAVLLVLGWSFVLLAMRRLPLNFSMSGVEVAALLLLATIFQCYVRNPVGLLSLGGDSVGGRAYFNVAIAVLGAILLASIRIPPDRIRTAMHCMLFGSLFSWITNTLAYFSPAVASYTGRFLGAWGRVSSADFGSQVELNAAVDDSRATRIGPAVEGAGIMSRWISSKRNPFRSLFHPVWGTLVILTCAMAAMSGYRNILIATGLTFAFATYYWGRMHAVIGAAILGGVVYLLLILINPIAPLPANIQRTLTILPGTWDQRYKDDAKESTEWRVEMWKLALFTDRYIQNKILGDGLGLTNQEFQFIMNINTMKSISDEMTQERAMMTQAYHSGPVQTIRVTGYLGLVVLIYAMIVVSVRAHRLICRYKGTDWFGPVLFMTLHMVWHPIFFVFVFGAFKEDVPALLMNMGILRLLEKNLPPPKGVAVSAPAAPLASIPETRRSRTPNWST